MAVQAAHDDSQVEQPAYEPRAYWEQLLSSSFDTSGVAYAYLAVSFNEAMYHAERDVTLRAVRRHRSAQSLRSALDIGCGTGVWLQFWRGLGAQHVMGVDLTAASISRLQHTGSADALVQADVSQPGLDLGRRFDVISAMSVLLHIVEAEKLSTAVGNLARHLAPGGRMFMIEPVVLHRWWGPEFGPKAHSRVRGLEEWRAVLAQHDLEIVELRPVTFLLANPIDAKRPSTFRLYQRYWDFILRRVGRREGIGARVGRALELVDRPLRRLSRGGPSAKLMVVRRHGTPAADNDRAGSARP